MTTTCRLTGEVFPNRTLGAWFLPKPLVKHREQTLGVSEWVGSSLVGKPTCRGAFLVKPEDDPEWVRQHARRLGLSGLKCYHTFALRTPTLQAEIPEYLPEAVMQVAHEEGWFVTLHMVKDRAVADPGNQHWIRTYCERYPDMKLILAHSARGFQPSHNFEGLPRLADLPNLYFDSSANCEPMAHAAIIRTFGHDRFMFGTDFGAASHQPRPPRIGRRHLLLGLRRCADLGGSAHLDPTGQHRPGAPALGEVGVLGGAAHRPADRRRVLGQRRAPVRALTPAPEPGVRAGPRAAERTDHSATVFAAQVTITTRSCRTNEGMIPTHENRSLSAGDAIVDRPVDHRPGRRQVVLRRPVRLVVPGHADRPDRRPRLHHGDRHGASAAGIAAQPPEEAQRGIPPHWNVYLTVDDVDAAAIGAVEHGGAVLAEPFDVFDAGRMATIR